MLVESKSGAEFGLADEDETMVLGKLIQEVAQLVDEIDGQGLGVVDNGDDRLAHGVELAHFSDQAGCTLGLGTGGFELQPLAEQAQEI